MSHLSDAQTPIPIPHRWVQSHHIDLYEGDVLHRQGGPSVQPSRPWLQQTSTIAEPVGYQDLFWELHGGIYIILLYTIFIFGCKHSSLIWMKALFRRELEMIEI